MSRPADIRLAAALALALTTIGAMGGAARAESPAPHGASPPAPRANPPLFQWTRTDAWFGVVSVVAVGAAGFADLRLREQALASDGPGARDLARGVRALGSPAVLGPAVLLGYLTGRALDRPVLAAACKRVGASLLVTGVAVGGLKIAVGRVRPDESALESDPYQPFSGHSSFPSGHAAMAFAAATALDRETQARWVPWVAYPLAGLVGWSRVRDDRHWTSDVVAGAALGLWLAGKTEDALQARAARPARVGLLLGGEGAPIQLGARLSF